MAGFLRMEVKGERALTTAAPDVDSFTVHRWAAEELEADVVHRGAIR